LIYNIVMQTEERINLMQKNYSINILKTFSARQFGFTLHSYLLNL